MYTLYLENYTPLHSYVWLYPHVSSINNMLNKIPAYGSSVTRIPIKLCCTIECLCKVINITFVNACKQLQVYQIQT